MGTSSPEALHRLHRSFMLALGFLALPAAAACAQRADEEPVEVAARYVAAMKMGDYETMADLVHPEALSQLRNLFEPLLESPAGPALARELLGVASAAQAAELPDEDYFAGLMRFVVSQQPGFDEALRTAEVEMLGHVKEGSDTVHVVYRLDLMVEGISLTQIDVFSMKRFDGTWRGLLKGDLTNMAAALRQAVGG